jgi:hypothetical protein
MRPTVQSLGRRLGVTFACLLFVGTLGWGLYNNQQQRSAEMTTKEQQQNHEMGRLANEMTTDIIDRGLITQEEIDEFDRNNQERVDTARARIDAGNDKVLLAFFCGMGFFGFIGLLSPASLLWERVIFSTNVRGEMVVRRRNSIFWTSKHFFPEDTIKNLYLVAREHHVGNRKSGYTTIGWMWEVYAQGDDGEGVAVSIDLSPRRPMENRRLPENVQQVTDALSTFTGCPLRLDYTVTNIDSVEHGLFNTHVRQSGTRTTRNLIDSGTVHREYESIDELPPEIHARFEEAQARGETGSIRIERSQSVQFNPGQAITYRAPDGSEHTYQSVEEMPPELQKIFRDLKQ